MRLETVNDDEEYIREEDVKCLMAEDRYAEGKGKTDLVDERIEQEAW